MDEIRIGVIGAGGRGKIARNFHKPDEGSRVIAGMDIDPEAVKDFSQRFPDALATMDMDELLGCDGVNTVLICSPDYVHVEHAVAALKAGKAVFLEKPMAITVEGADRILDAAESSGSKLFVGHNMRYMPIMRKMKELIDGGVIGEVRAVWCRHFINYGGDAYFRDWHAEREYSNSLLLQKGCHDIDIIHWLAGGFTNRVTAFGNLSVYDKCERRAPDEKPRRGWKAEHWPPLEQTGFNPVIDVEDLSMVLMQLDNGVQASYLQCHYTPDCCRNYRVIGTRGCIENMGHFSHSAIRVWEKRPKINWNWIRGDYDVYTEDRPSGGHGGSDPRIAEEFLRYVREGGETTATPFSARNSVAVGDLAARSLRSGGTPQEIKVRTE